MQRHFSSRGEALPEVTAARMLVGGKRSPKSRLGTPAGRRVALEQWFSRPAEAKHGRKKKQPKPKEDITTSL
jgi:hypothetical protein